ncbi:MAG: TonB family protein [Candidatus Firestonebacteria bacterium]
MNRKDDSLRYTLLISLVLHGLLLIALAGINFIHGTGKSVYLTEVTLLGEMPYGKGLGQKGEASIGKKPGMPVSAPQKSIAKPEVKKAVKRTQIEKKTEEEILKLRKEAPIGIEDAAARITEGVVDGAVMGGGFGEDNEKPGMLDGSLEISGPIASRGILHRFTPGYPDWAKRQGVEGSVQVQMAVNPKGDVKDPVVIKTCGSKELDQLVIEWLRSWKFDSLPLSVNQIDQEGKITFKFNLKK